MPARVPHANAALRNVTIHGVGEVPQANEGQAHFQI